MTILYSCRHDGDQYRITKFDEDLSPTSSYLCTAKECECPAGPRPMCRHREMLPMFIARGAIGTGWMYDYDRGGWVDQRWMVEEAKPYPSPELAADLETFFSGNPGADDQLPGLLSSSAAPSKVTATWRSIGPAPTEDELAIQKLSREDPAELRNTIAAAVAPAPKRRIHRRF